MNRKRVVFMGTVAGTLVLAQSAFAAEIAAVPSQNALSVQTGETVEKAQAVPAYLYQGNNYFMLRDVGKIVGYQVNWDDAAKKISMTKDADARSMEGLSAATEANIIDLDMRLNVNGVCTNNFGYRVTRINGKAVLVMFIGEKNPAFDPTKVEPLLLTDEEAKQKAIEADGFEYKVEEQRVSRYFNMEELAN